MRPGSIHSSQTIVCILLAVGALVETRAQAASPSALQLRAAEALARTGDWEVRWDEETGSPWWIEEQRLGVGAALRRPRPFEPESLAASFIRNHAGLFPLRPGRDSLAVVPRVDSPAPRTRRKGMITSVRTEQFYMGLPVENGGYAVSMSPDGKVLSMGGRFYAGIELDPRPTIDAEGAARIAMHEVGAGADSVVRPIVLAVARRNGRDHLVWAVTVPEDPMHVWIVRVDAHDGHVVGRDNRVIID